MVQTSGWDTASRHVSVHVLRSAEATEERQRNEHTVRPGGRKGKERKGKREEELKYFCCQWMFWERLSLELKADLLLSQIRVVRAEQTVKQ